MSKDSELDDQQRLTSFRNLCIIIWNHKLAIGIITLIFPAALALSPIHNSKQWTTHTPITLPDELALKWLNDPLPLKKILGKCDAPDNIDPYKALRKLFAAASAMQYQNKFHIQFEKQNRSVLPSEHSFIATGANHIFKGGLRTVMPNEANTELGHLEIDTLHPDIAEKWLSEYVAFLDQSLVVERRNSLISFYKCTKREDLELIEMDIERLRKASSYAEALGISEYEPVFKEEDQELPFWRGTKLLSLMIRTLEDAKKHIENEIELINEQPNNIWTKPPTGELLFVSSPSPPRSNPKLSRRNQIIQLVLSTVFGFLVGTSFALFVQKK